MFIIYVEISNKNKLSNCCYETTEYLHLYLYNIIFNYSIILGSLISLFANKLLKFFTLYPRGTVARSVDQVSFLYCYVLNRIVCMGLNIAMLTENYIGSV